MDKCLGFGGLGDCFIVMLKLLEYKKPLVYTHIDTNPSRLELSKKLLDHHNIKHDCYLVGNIRDWWYSYSGQFDKCFNVMAKGYIDIPRRPYHWEPCKDEGYLQPFVENIPEKQNLVAVQIQAGPDTSQRNYKSTPIVEFVKDNYNEEQVLWFGTDKDFNPGCGTNYSGQLDLISALEKIAQCKSFVGFNGILLYWALWHKIESFLFTDHQDTNDLRIHSGWKKYLSYDVDNKNNKE